MFELLASVSQPSGSANQSINQRCICRAYVTCPGAPTIVSGKHDQEVHSSRFLKVQSTVISNVVKVGRKDGRCTSMTELRYNVSFNYFNKHGACLCIIHLFHFISDYY